MCQVTLVAQLYCLKTCRHVSTICWRGGGGDFDCYGFVISVRNMLGMEGIYPHSWMERTHALLHKWFMGIFSTYAAWQITSASASLCIISKYTQLTKLNNCEWCSMSRSIWIGITLPECIAWETKYYAKAIHITC